MKAFKFSVYILVIFLFTDYFIELALLRGLPMDEWQHTYLAWASARLNKVVYLDIFDNHGPLYTWLNALLIKYYNPLPGLYCIFRLRIFNVLILAINFLICFEITAILTSNYFSAILSPLIFSLNFTSIHAYQIRPDNLQSLLFSLSLYFLLISLGRRSKITSYLSGICLGLMLLTNIKSLIALAAISTGVVVMVTIYKKKEFQHVMRPIFFALTGTYFLGLIYIALFYSFKGYVRYNLILNFLIVFDPLKHKSFGWMKEIYIGKQFWVTVAMMAALCYWGIQAICTKKEVKDLRIFLFSIVIVLLLGKCFGLWLQYDLIFMPLLACMASAVIIDIYLTVVSFLFLGHPSLKKLLSHMLLIGITGLALNYVYFKEAKTNVRLAGDRVTWLQKRFDLIRDKTAAGELVDTLDVECPGQGFAPMASYMIVKIPAAMKLESYLEGKDIYGEEYIQMLENKKVKLLIGSDTIANFPERTAKYIRDNYNYTMKCLWERKSEFKVLPIP
jgi:hypothetical protein